jgi:hypothetical protein
MPWWEIIGELILIVVAAAAGAAAFLVLTLVVHVLINSTPSAPRPISMMVIQSDPPRTGAHRAGLQGRQRCRGPAASLAITVL